VIALRPGSDPVGLDDLREFLTGKGLRTQAVPEQLEIVATVERNPAGKILKHKLREQFVETKQEGDNG
jgi:non-ribosomal peptide synthetase component E (peptide arylation enzyme)